MSSGRYKIGEKDNPVDVQGDCDAAFQRVHDTFSKNFALRGEVGAAVSVFQDGKKVVDLWGGTANVETGQKWQADTIVCVMSISKSIAAIAVHMLIERGKISLADKVSEFWPGFAQAGKAEMTVGEVLGGRAGLLFVDHAPSGCLLDWDTVIEGIEKQEPEPPAPGTGAYHSMTMGFLLGEIVRRVDGRPIETFVAEEISAPLGLDFFFGVPDADLERIAPMVPNMENNTLRLINVPESNLGRAWHLLPKTEGLPFNDRAINQGVCPSFNGISNARAMAHLYACLGNGGALDGVTLVSEETTRRMRAEQWNGICGMTTREYRYGYGFFLNKAPLAPMGPGNNAFGHIGAGGAIAFADPDANISFCYTPNYFCGGAGVGDRCAALVETLQDIMRS